jgi:hypothetical protein
MRHPPHTASAAPPASRSLVGAGLVATSLAALFVLFSYPAVAVVLVGGLAALGTAGVGGRRLLAARARPDGPTRRESPERPRRDADSR